tara:strand:- start:40060 stop:40890 length:831 start_codon:yes stop_codon:yes gene_type:complete
MNTLKTFKEFEKVYELNHQSFGPLGVNDPGFGQGAHVGNWGGQFGNPSQGVRGTFGNKGDAHSQHLPQKTKQHDYPSVVYDPSNNTYLVADEVQELLRQYDIKCKQNSEEPQDFGNIDSKTVEFIQNYLQDENVNESKINIDSVEKTIQYTMDHNNMNPYHPVQINIKDTSKNEEFLRFCEKYSEFTNLEEIKGYNRSSSDKDFEYIVSRSNGGVCGIKVNHSPQWKINEWEKWDDGYIENFVRTEEDYFIWQYIPMKYLNEILTRFQNNLSYFET